MLKSTDEVKVNPYHTRYVEGSEFLGFIPVENRESYPYAIPEADNKFVIAAFAVPPERVVEIYSASSKAMIKMAQEDFIFESEYIVLKGKNKEAAKEMAQRIKDNPFVLAFCGIKHNKGMRFKNREEAMEFLSLFTYFDEVLDEKDLQENNSL